LQPLAEEREERGTHLGPSRAHNNREQCRVRGGGPVRPWPERARAECGDPPLVGKLQGGEGSALYDTVKVAGGGLSSTPARCSFALNQRAGDK